MRFAAGTHRCIEGSASAERGKGYHEAEQHFGCWSAQEAVSQEVCDEIVREAQLAFVRAV